MSLTTAQRFLQRLEREETLRQQLYISGINSLDKLVQFAHGKGFIVSQEEMKVALETFKPSLKTANLEPIKQLAAGK
ncbi:MAG: Nif11-like leader peptide family natural product precursor [Anaerolineae bacterium]|nr:Nif11-like leader peptide family natural product precursor [Anaerolineae bacterium]MDW8172315.1 Nif11-like leader peptide family natural product precursor [Anaerolineae bacterium]